MLEANFEESSTLYRLFPSRFLGKRRKDEPKLLNHQASSFYLTPSEEQKVIYIKKGHYHVNYYENGSG